jgi:hypothetical protein
LEVDSSSSRIGGAARLDKFGIEVLRFVYVGVALVSDVLLLRRRTRVVVSNWGSRGALGALTVTRKRGPRLRGILTDSLMSSHRGFIARMEHLCGQCTRWESPSEIL